MHAQHSRKYSVTPVSQGRMEIMAELLRDLIAATPELPTSLEPLDGEWELVFTSVNHGIFRSSPFFLAIQDAYARAGVPEKAELFFKLHEMQTCSWGISKIGRVAQTIDASKGMLYSEFDTNLLSLTTIPVRCRNAVVFSPPSCLCHSFISFEMLPTNILLHGRSSDFGSCSQPLVDQ